MGLYSASGDAPPEKRWRFLFEKSETFLDANTVPETLPAWVTEADLDFYTEEFKRTGFRKRYLKLFGLFTEANWEGRTISHKLLPQLSGISDPRLCLSSSETSRPRLALIRTL